MPSHPSLCLGRAQKQLHLAKQVLSLLEEGVLLGSPSIGSYTGTSAASALPATPGWVSCATQVWGWGAAGCCADVQAPSAGLQAAASALPVAFWQLPSDSKSYVNISFGRRGLNCLNLPSWHTFKGVEPAHRFHIEQWHVCSTLCEWSSARLVYGWHWWCGCFEGNIRLEALQEKCTSVIGNN